jgi:hypothetical protein
MLSTKIRAFCARVEAPRGSEADPLPPQRRIAVDPLRSLAKRALSAETGHSKANQVHTWGMYGITLLRLFRNSSLILLYSLPLGATTVTSA